MKLNKINSLLMVATLTIGLAGCSSNNGIKGFEKNIDLAKTYEELKSDLSDLELSNDLGTQLNYENVKLGNNFIGTMIIHKNEDDDYIDYVSYDISSDNNLNTEEIINELTEIYGDPVHKENYNNNRIDVAYYLFRNGNVNISIPIQNTINTINYELVDDNADDIIKEQESLKKYRESNKEAQEAYDLLSSLANLEGKPITEAIENKNVEYYSSAKLDDNILFMSETDFLGYDAELYCAVRDPYADDSYGDFIGEISYSYLAVDTGSDSKDELNSKLEEIFGKLYTDEYNQTYTENGPLTIQVGNTTNSDNSKCVYIGPDINSQYHLIDPSFNNDESTESIKGYDDVDLAVLHAEDNDDYRDVRKYSQSWTKCVNAARDYVLERLKSPSTADFCDDSEITVTKMGETFKVEGYVDAENSFGATVRTDFTLYLNSDYTVKNGFVGDTIV